MRIDKDHLTAPIEEPRRGWKQAFDRMHDAGDDEPILDELTTEFDEEDWEW